MSENFNSPIEIAFCGAVPMDEPVKVSHQLPSLLQGFEAIDRLNSWVRSPGFYRMQTGARGHIYAMKRVALERAATVFPCEHRTLDTIVTCRDCKGTGHYIDTYGHEWHHCRMCGNSGNVRLSFVESRIGDRFRWHTPRSSFPGHILSITGETNALESGWTVNQPGRDLTISEAARDLMTAEMFFLPRGSTCYRDSGLFDYFDGCRGCVQCYRLYVGEKRDVCVHCGSDEVYTGLGGHDGRLDFTVGCCAFCRETPTAALFSFAMPVELMDQPNVREWMERHPRKQQGGAA